MNQWQFHQINDSNAFVQGYLETPIYMSQQTGFVDSTHPDYICKLHRPIYIL